MAKRARSNARGADDTNSGAGNANNGTDSPAGDIANADSRIIDPATIGGTSADSGTADAGTGERRVRGRPRGSTNKKKTVHLDVGELADVILLAHSGLASLTNIEELELDAEKKEHNQLADALAKVADKYGLSEPLGLASHPLVALAFVCWSLYIPRIAAYRLRMAAERARDVTPTPHAPNPPASPAPPPSAAPLRSSAVMPGVPHGTPIVATPIPGFENAPPLVMKPN
jgi:hypothetical protein